MDSLLIFLALFALVSAIDIDKIKEPQTDEMKEAEARQNFLTKIAAECSEEAGVEIEVARRLLLGDLSLRSDEAMCFVRCIFKKEGFWSEADVPQIDYIVESLKHSVNVKRKKLKKMIKKCAEHKVENPCETAFLFLECYLNDKLVVKAQPYDPADPTATPDEPIESKAEPKTEL